MFFKKPKDSKPRAICEFTGTPSILIHVRSSAPIETGSVTGAYEHNGFIIFTSARGGACVAKNDFVAFEVIKSA